MQTHTVMHAETFFAAEGLVVLPAPKTTVTVRLSLQAQDAIWPKVATVCSSSKTSTLHADPEQVPPLHHNPVQERRTVVGSIVSITNFSIYSLRAGTRFLRPGLRQPSEKLWIRWLRVEVPCTVVADNRGHGRFPDTPNHTLPVVQSGRGRSSSSVICLSRRQRVSHTRVSDPTHLGFRSCPCALPALILPTPKVRSIPIRAAAILASSSSGRDECIVGPGVGTTVGDCVGAGEGAGVGEIVGDIVGAGDGERVGPGVGADAAGKSWMRGVTVSKVSPPAVIYTDDGVSSNRERGGLQVFTKPDRQNCCPCAAGFGQG